MHQVLKISELCQNNPTVIMDQEKKKAQKCSTLAMVILLISYSLVAVLILVLISIAAETATKQLFKTIGVCYGMELFAYILFMAAGSISITKLKSQYGGQDFKPALIQAYLIMSIFMVSFLLEIIILIVLVSLDPNGQSKYNSVIFVALPLFTELIPITTVYYLHRKQLIHSQSVSSRLDSFVLVDSSLRESELTDPLSIDALRSDVEDRLRNNSTKRVFMHLSGQVQRNESQLRNDSTSDTLLEGMRQNYKAPRQVETQITGHKSIQILEEGNLMLGLIDACQAQKRITSNHLSARLP